MIKLCNDGPFLFKVEFFYLNKETGYLAKAGYDFQAGTIPTPEMIATAHAQVDELMKDHPGFRRANRHETMVEVNPQLQGFALPGPEDFEPAEPKEATA